MLDSFLSSYKIKEPEQLSPLVLAYIGDAVYELAVRKYLVSSGVCNVNALHKEAVKYVKADTQARVLHAMEGRLDVAEAVVARRGRNAKSGHPPRGANVSSYRHSTGFECLIGYLYLKGDTRRLDEIMSLVFSLIAGGQV